TRSRAASPDRHRRSRPQLLHGPLAQRCAPRGHGDLSKKENSAAGRGNDALLSRVDCGPGQPAAGRCGDPRRDRCRSGAARQAGLVDEVKRLRGRYRLTPALPSMRAVGYRQVWQYLENEISERETRERAIAATRQLAKRQLTWLRSLPGLLRLDAGGPQDAPVALELLLDEVR